MGDVMDTRPCPGKLVPFGFSPDHPECKSCARAKAPSGDEPLMGPVDFETVCDYKVETK